MKLITDLASGLGLVEAEFARLDKAVRDGDLSQATFPRTGEAARIELQSRLSSLKWVLEMMPQLPRVQKLVPPAADARQLREAAIEMLQQASQIDGQALHAVTHVHRRGHDTYLVWGRDEAAASAALEARGVVKMSSGDSLSVSPMDLDDLAAVPQWDQAEPDADGADRPRH